MTVTTMQFSDDLLMAYADGEVDADTRRKIETAMASDPSLAQRIAKYRELRMDLDAAFAGVLDEPVPDRLVETALMSPAAPGTKATSASTVTDLNAARAAKNPLKSRDWSWPEWGAIAASLIVGVLAGHSALKSDDTAMFAASDTGIVASGTLEAALTEQPSGAKDAPVLIGLSFKAKSGEYCRTFSTTAAAGFACREADTWRVKALSDSEARNVEYRQAGSVLPPEIVAAIESTMDGEALDSSAEQAARARGWKK